MLGLDDDGDTVGLGELKDRYRNAEYFNQENEQHKEQRRDSEIERKVTAAAAV